MYACICNAITVDEVVDAVDAGAASLAAVGSLTRAGTSCGSCHDHLDDIIATRCVTCPMAQLAIA